MANQINTGADMDLVTRQGNDEPGGESPFLGGEDLAPFDDHEFELLMSLALDGQLNAAEAARFETLLTGADAGGQSAAKAEWALWQELDGWLATEPHVVPGSTLATGVMQRVAVHERRKRLWLGATIGAVAVLLWGTGLLGVLGLLALLSSNEALWLSQIVDSLAYWWTGLSGLVVSALRSVTAILSTAQARAVLFVYCSLAAGMLGLWTFWLRRTTHSEIDSSVLQ